MHKGGARQKSLRTTALDQVENQKKLSSMSMNETSYIIYGRIKRVFPSLKLMGEVLEGGLDLGGWME